jgi:hypothetical protein
VKPLPVMNFCIRLSKFLLFCLIAVCLAPSASHGQVVINEIMAENANTLANDNDFPDWIELYNTTDTQANIGGWYIREVEDRGGSISSNLFRFPASVPIPPFGRLVVWCDNRTNSPGYHTRFGLPKTGTSLTLLRNDFSIVVGGGVSFGYQLQDLSIGRVPDGGAWTLNLPSPNTNNVPYPQFGVAIDVKINEWAALNSLIGGSTSNDWIEIFNTSTNPVLLTGLVLADVPAPVPSKFHAFTNLCFIGGEEFVRIWCDNERKPGDHVNFALSSTSGNTVSIYAADRSTVLEQISFLGNSNSPGYWVTNQTYGRLPDGGPLYPDRFIRGTPNDSNFQLMTNIVVNEVLSHTDPPLEDAIELRNLTDQVVDLSYWFISNKKNTPKMFRIPQGVTIGPFGYHVFFEYLGMTNETPRRGFNTSGERDPGDFALNSAHGDEVWIFSADANTNLTGLRGSLQFDQIDNGVSFGPWRNTAGEVEVVPMRQRTFGGVLNPTSVQQFRESPGAANTSTPRFGPIVISEIYYHPPDIKRIGQFTNDNDLHEFIEVYNTATTNVLMYDPVHYVYADGRTNTWRIRGVVDEAFPTNFVMTPGQIVLFVNFAMTNTIALNDFRNRFNVPEHVPMFGPYGNNLDNSRGEIYLRRPDPPQPPGRVDEGFVPYVVVDRVEYDDDPPWPVQADGHTNSPAGFDPGGVHIGYSLQRITVENYGDDPINWIAGFPSPGRQVVKIESIIRNGDAVTIRFRAWAGSGYTIQYNTTASSTGWRKLVDIAPQATSGVRQYTDQNISLNGQRYYRIATPIVSGDDSDGDGMPDAWEDLYELESDSAADALDDPDNDGLNNLREYLAGTHPRSNGSSLRLSVIGLNPVRLEFFAVSNKTYTIEYQNVLASGSWTKLLDFSAQGTSGARQTTDPSASGTRFYRLRTPQMP